MGSSEFSHRDYRLQVQKKTYTKKFASVHTRMSVSGFNLTLLLLVVCFHASVILAEPVYDLFESGSPLYEKRGVMSNNRYNWGANGRLNNAFWKRGQILKRALEFDDY